MKTASQLLPFDQRGALKRLMAQYKQRNQLAQMEELKVLVT